MTTDRLALGHTGPVVSSASRIALYTDARDGLVRPRFDDVYEAEFAFVWRTLKRFGVRSASIDDATQDVFLVVHRKLESFDMQSSFRAWLYGIAVRVASDYRRRRRRKDAPCVGDPGDIDQRFSSSVPPPSAGAEQAEQVALLDALLSRLDDEKREVLVLSELEEMTVPEIAACTESNVNTIYSRLRAARREFEAAYQRHQLREGVAP